MDADQDLLQKVDELTREVRGLKGAQNTSNELQRRIMDVEEKADKADATAGRAETGVAASEQSRKRLRVGVFAVVAFVVAISAVFTVIIVREHGFTTRLQATQQRQLDGDLARAETSFTGCSTRNSQIHDLVEQTNANALVLPTFFALLRDSAAALPAGTAGDQARADFAKLASQAAALPAPAVQKPADCGVYLRQAQQLRAQGAHEAPTAP